MRTHKRCIVTLTINIGQSPLKTPTPSKKTDFRHISIIGIFKKMIQGGSFELDDKYRIEVCNHDDDNQSRQKISLSIETNYLEVCIDQTFPSGLREVTNFEGTLPDNSLNPQSDVDANSAITSFNTIDQAQLWKGSAERKSFGLEGTSTHPKIQIIENFFVIVTPVPELMAKIIFPLAFEQVEKST